MFSEDSAACFENNEVQSTLTKLLEDLNNAAAEVSESCLNDLWEAVAISNEAIEKEHQSLQMQISDYYKFLLAEKKNLEWKKACLMNNSRDINL
uniref:Uncharacterized protein n=1 Tax=Ditylenchus dipsaci TaxID=166011 RepID=A0A915E7L7_9BILA